MSRPSSPTRLVLLVSLTLGLGLPAGLSAAAARPGHAARHHSPTRAAQRRALAHRLHRHPRIAAQRWFLRKAALLGVDVPITLRLTPRTGQAPGQSAPADDTILLALGTDPTEPPLPAGFAAGDATSTLSGTIQGALRFSQDASGYGSLGAVDLGFGATAMTATGFDLVRDGGGCPLLTTTTVDVSDAPGSVGYVNLFDGSFSIDLHTRFSFAATSWTSCATGQAMTAFMDGQSEPPLPLRLDGTFRISPAITADGRVRLGKLAIAGAQNDSYAELHTCTDANQPCTGVLPGRISATAFGAEMLVGHVS